MSLIYMSSRVALPSGGGGGSFTPLFDLDFNGLSNGASISADSGGTVGKRFDYWGTFANGFGSQAQTTIKMPGKTSAAAFSIESGNDGGIGGGTGPNGGFGGGIIFPSAVRTFQGEDLYIGLSILFPTGFNFNTPGNGQLKFIRIIQESGGGSELGQKIENFIINNGTANCTGLALASEIVGANQAQSDTWKSVDRRPSASNNWMHMCMQTRAHNTPSLSIRRWWIDGQLSSERTDGNVNHWYEGGWQTLAFQQSPPDSYPEFTLNDPSGYLSGIMFFTYWNGNAQATQTCYVQRLVMHKNAADLNGTDEFGNKFIDMSSLL